MMNFNQFYTDVFLPEHQRKANQRLHITGTLMGLAWIPFCFAYWTPFALVLFPVVHAVPGLIGHKLYESNAQVGDVRITRKDFPLWWFIVGNHKLTWTAFKSLFS